MEARSITLDAKSPDWVEGRVEWLFRIRAEAAAARAAEAEAVLRARQRRLENVLALLRAVVAPVLEDVAVALRRRGVEATVSEVLDPPRITVRVAEPNGAGHGPPRVAEGCLTFTASSDLAAVSARQETWRWRVGGTRQEFGAAALADLDRGWVSDRAMEFVSELLLGQDRPNPRGAGSGQDGT